MLQIVFQTYPAGMSQKAMTGTWKIEECCTERAQSLFITVAFASLMRFCKKVSLCSPTPGAIDDRNSNGCFYVGLDLRLYGFHRIRHGAAWSQTNECWRGILEEGVEISVTRGIITHYDHQFSTDLIHVYSFVIDTIYRCQPMTSSLLHDWRTQQLTPCPCLWICHPFVFSSWLKRSAAELTLAFLKFIQRFWNTFYEKIFLPKYNFHFLKLNLRILKLNLHSLTRMWKKCRTVVYS